MYFTSTIVVSFALATGNTVHLNSSGEGWVTAISNTGIAAGTSSSANQYFMWSEKNGNQFIGGVAAGNGAGGQAGISTNGAYICGTVLNSFTNQYEAGFYTVATDTWTPLGGIGGSSGQSTSSGWGISGDGSTIVGLAWEDAGTAYATTWSHLGNSNSLGTTVPGSSTRANSVNYDGTVVVGWQDASYRQGAVWVNNKQELISRPDGEPALEASEVSDNGLWVTGMGSGSFGEDGETYLYHTKSNACIVIPNIDGNSGLYMAGAGITNSGQTIVGGTWDFGVPASFGNAFIWREGIGTMLLEDYFDEVGVFRPLGFHFAFASCISDDGNWIAGWGNNGNVGDTVSFLCTYPNATNLR